MIAATTLAPTTLHAQQPAALRTSDALNRVDAVVSGSSGFA